MKASGQATPALARRYGLRAREVLERLRRIRAERGRITGADVDALAAELGIPRAHVYGAASFYADLGFEQRGERDLRVCAGTACFAATGGAHLAEAERAVEAGTASLQRVYCLGYCYASPAALDGELPCAGPDLADQLAGRSERRDRPIPFEAAVPDPRHRARRGGDTRVRARGLPGDLRRRLFDRPRHRPAARALQRRLDDAAERQPRSRISPYWVTGSRPVWPICRSYRPRPYRRWA